MMSRQILPQVFYGGSKESRNQVINKYLEDFIQENTRVAVERFSPKDASYGIALIKEFTKTLVKQNIGVNHRVYVFEDAHKITPEGQNALLKSLEEPPINTLLLFETESSSSLLPTILSRCLLVQIDSKRQIQTDSVTAEEISLMSLAELFNLAEKYAHDRESAKMAINFLLVYSREIVEKAAERQIRRSFLSYIEFLLQAYEWSSSTTVTQKLLLENCFLGFWNLKKKY